LATALPGAKPSVLNQIHETQKTPRKEKTPVKMKGDAER
jgi:hypothetical protein